jgi:hypothetical protein
LRLSKKVKSLIVIGVIVVILFSAFAFLPQGSKDKGNIVPSNGTSTSSPSPSTASTTTAPNQDPDNPFSQWIKDMGFSALTTQNFHGIISSAQTLDSTVWRSVAETAWAYFGPTLGVNELTGLPYASSTDFPYFTDWDLGAYIQAIIDAENIGLIGRDGTWGADHRLDMVITFLETRNLTSNGVPYQWYQSATGLPDVEHSLNDGNVADSGNLLVSLKNCELAHPELKARIDNVVMNVTDYSSMVPAIAHAVGSNRIYDYYVASGFAAFDEFWPRISDVPDKILSNILAGNSTIVNKERDGKVTLPASKLSCEPLLLSIFDLPHADPRLVDLTYKVYLAHEEYYTFTGVFRAFSEGNSPPTTFAYEWVILPDGQTWLVLDESNTNLPISPIVYTKVAMSFLALYNTTYAKNMCIYLENSLDTERYLDGVDETGQEVTSYGSNTNGLVLSAAKYALAKYP